MRAGRGVGLAALLLALVAPRPGAALTLAPMSLAELTAHAPIVVRARCTDRQSVADRDGRVDSVARFAVIERVKGTAPEHLDVRQLGGRAGGLEVVVPGAPLSEPGDEALLFLAPAASGMLEVVGVAHGYLPVAVLPGGEAMVRVPARLAPELAARPVQPLSRVVERIRALDAGAP